MIRNLAGRLQVFLLISFLGGSGVPSVFGAAQPILSTSPASQTTPAAIVPVEAIAAPAAVGEKPSRGLEAAKAISMVTGVAISPLLGVAAVGAWDYLHASEARRAQLPWFAQPWFWVPALLMVLVVGVKDMFGAMLPPGWKKPFDVAEAIENKVSGLVATGAFVPFIASIFGASAVAPSTGPGPSAWFLNGGGFAAIDFSWLGNLLTIPAAMVAFALVWLVSHTINILILISPWGAVDAALKSARLSLLSVITVASFANPYVGAVLSVVVIIIAYCLAGWSFRLLIFGTVFSWDFFTLRRLRTQPVAGEVRAFTARAIGDAPIRSYGKLVRNEKGEMQLEYRPWLCLAKRTLVVPAGRWEVGRSVLYPELVSVDPGQDSYRSLFLFPPRYRGHESRVAEVLQVSEVREIGLLRGVKAIGARLRSLFGMGQSESGALTSASS